MQDRGSAGSGLRLGEILALDPERLSTALAHARARGQRLGSVLIKLGYAGSDRVALALAAQHGVDAALEADLAEARSERHLLGAIQAWRLLAVPLGRDARGMLAVAVVDPGDLAVLDEIRACVGARVRFRVAAEASLRQTLERLYGPPSTRQVPAARRNRPSSAGSPDSGPESDSPSDRPAGGVRGGLADRAPDGPADRASPDAAVSLAAAVPPTPTLALWHFSLRWRVLVIGAFFVPAVFFVVTFARKALDAPDHTALAAGRHEAAGSGLAVEIPDSGWIHLPGNDIAERDGDASFRGTWLQRGGTPREPALGVLLVRWSVPDGFPASFDAGTLRRWIDSMGDRLTASKKAGAIAIGELECALTHDRREPIGICRGPARRYASYDLVAWLWSAGSGEVVATLFFSQDSAVYVEEEIEAIMKSVELL